MIELIRKGQYKLIETRKGIKILTLGKDVSFVWITVGDIGEILAATHKSHKVDHILAIGDYRIYNVKDEPNITDLIHLELFVGKNKWQGYLLLTGLPINKKIRSRIVPTIEVITNKKKYISLI